MHQMLYSVKKCADCGDIKPLSEFHKDSRKKDGRRSKCKNCRIHENASQYTRTTKYNRTKKYKNFSEIKYKDLELKQSHKCLICGKREALVIDHSHQHGAVRGLLCNRCNIGLGMFLDSPRRLINALYYIVVKEVWPPLRKNLLVELKKFKKSSQNIWNFAEKVVSL